MNPINFKQERDLGATLQDASTFIKQNFGNYEIMYISGPSSLFTYANMRENQRIRGENKLKFLDVKPLFLLG